jgi:SAM-dependent methyltransferase
MDLSKGMLEQARQKNVYGEYHQMVMGETLRFASDSFDAALSVGVLTVGHAPATSLHELARVVRPGGHIIFTLRPDLYEDGGFKEVQTSLESDGKWKLVELGDPMQILPKGEPDVLHQVWVYEVTA